MRIQGAVLLFGLVLAGCGSSSRETPGVELVPVTGTVKLGGTPTSDVMVSLSPMGSTKGQGAWGKTDSTGGFKLIHMSNKDGVEPGEYIASFSYFVKADGTPIPPNTSPTEAAAVQGIASPWNDPASDSLSQRVNVKKEGMTPLSFDVPPAKSAKKS